MFSTAADESAAREPAGSRTQPGQQPSGNGRSPEEAPNAARFSPAVLRLAREHNVDLSRLRGSGLGGRITRKDVQAFIDSHGAEPPPAGALPSLTPPMAQPVAAPQAETVQELQRAFAEPSAARGPQAAQRLREAPEPERRAAVAVPAPGAEGDTLEPLTATRRAIARHMLQSVQTAPHAWMMVEVDVTRLVAFRERAKEQFRTHEGVDLTYLPFMIKATVAALKQHPRLNSSWTDDGIVLRRRINIGIAVNTDQGLVVPVIHDADELSIAGLAKRIADLAARARSRRLRIEDIEGGTFTVDNTGPLGSIVSGPIINQPQCAIVTMESIVKRPVVVDDAIAVRSMMNCCLSFDHRIVDGGDVGPFMKTLKASLEAMGDGTQVY
jgi:2-oxoisovalerate dehydrogenase E2 component (dihydrolipoyl transacylase)